MFHTLIELLRSQAGQIVVQDDQEDSVGVDTGTEPTDTSDAPSDVDPFAAAADQIQASVPAEGGQQTQAPQAPETFLSDSDLDPRTLDPKLQAIFKRMQGVYTKRMQGLAEIRQKAETVDRFYQDQDFARQTLTAWAAQNGYQLAPIGQSQNQSQQPQQQGQYLTAQEQAALEGLPPELQWLAGPVGGAVNQAVQKAVAQALQPLVQHQQKTNQQAREAEYDRYATELAQQVPHWEEHEETMSELLDFLSSPAQSHPKFGSKLRMLYDLATAKSASIAEATKRINGAAKNRVVPARGGNKVAPPQDITKLNKNDAFDAAVRAAKTQLSR